MHNHDVSAYTHSTKALQSTIFVAWAKFFHTWKSTILFIVDYSVIKLCSKNLFGKMVYHKVIHVFKACCSGRVLSL